MSAGRVFLKILKGISLTANVIVSIAILIVAIAVIAVVTMTGSSTPTMPTSAALVINPQGELVEQLSGDPTQRAIDQLMGQTGRAQTRLRYVLAAIHEAKTDSRVKALVIDPRDMAPAGLSKLQAIGAAVKDFETTGKPVFAMTDFPGQSQYYLASTANTIFLNPAGRVLITGFGAYREYFKDAIDKLGIEWNVFRVGKYKSFVEPFIRNGMSKAAKEADGALLDVLWGSYQKDVTKARGLKSDALKNYTGNAPDLLAAVDGDAAKMALQAGLVDQLATHDQMHAAIAKVVGTGADGHGFNQIGFRDYLAATGYLRHNNISANEVAVIVAEGDILAGNQPPGKIGGESLSRLIRKARNNNRIKALVLRVDSPGGSAFASRMIMRQEQLTQQAGKPVIVSMGSLAASGGYWISMTADRIFAKPTTITGSIGIFGMFPTFQKSLAKLGIHNDGIGTTILSGMGRPTRAMTPQAKKLFRLTIQNGYNDFVINVSKTRHLKLAHVKQIAQGRVWSGKDAKRLGLIDQFGGLQDAIRAAAQLAGISGNYTVHRIKAPISFSSRLLIGLSSQARSTLGPLSLEQSTSVAGRALKRLHGFIRELAQFNDPNSLYAYCFCAKPMEL